MSGLPRSIAPWAETLAHVDAELALDLGPMLHVVDELVGRLDAHSVGMAGPVDGYDGTTNRGDPERILASEWLFAQELPWEFIRRAADNELLYLRRAHPEPPRRGRVIAIVDAGPDQIGPGRLVQLAALVVLDRRAGLAGGELGVSVLQSGKTHAGPLASVLPHWLTSRSSTPVADDQLRSALEGLHSEDRAWVLCGPRTASMLTGHARTIVSSVASWGVSGVTEMALRVGNSHARLQVPRSSAAIRALRGEGLLAKGPSASEQRGAAASVAATGRGAQFNSADSQLMWRGDVEGELYTARVESASAGGRVRRYRLPGGDVLAAASLNRRIVALLHDGERVWPHVVGKKLGRVDKMEFPVSDFDLASSDVEAILARPVQPLYFAGGSLLVQFGDSWWELSGEGAWEATTLLAAAPGHALDAPRRAWKAPGASVFVDGHRIPIDEGRLHNRLVLGPAGMVAFAAKPRVWSVHGQGQTWEEIGVGEQDGVLGMTFHRRQPGLVTLSPGHRLVRHVTARATQTLTRLAGPGHFSVHPVHPWISRSNDEGITVVNVATGEATLDVRSQA